MGRLNIRPGSPKPKEVLKQPKRQPSKLEARRTLRKFPKQKLTSQIKRIRKIPRLKIAPAAPVQITMVRATINRLTMLGKKALRGKLRGLLKQAGVDKVVGLDLKPSKPGKGPRGKKMIPLIKGPGGGFKYKDGANQVYIVVKKGPDGKTPVDVKLRGRLSLPDLPGKARGTVGFEYNHAERKLTARFSFVLPNIGKILNKKTQLSLQGSVGASPTGVDNTLTVGVGNSRIRAMFSVVTNVSRGRVTGTAVVGVGFSF